MNLFKDLKKKIFIQDLKNMRERDIGPIKQYWPNIHFLHVNFLK